MTLWAAEGIELNQTIVAFTVGQDPVLDRELLPFDCLASSAHAQMLAEVGLISAEDNEALQGALREAYALARRGELHIAPEQEDGHTALEHFLTQRTGEAGKRIHTGRSRNDQVIAALRLWAREVGLELLHQAEALVEALALRTDAHRHTLMPGYTHTRQGMPSSVGQLFGAIAEGLLSDMEAWQAPLTLAQRGALGSASGYGVPLPLNRIRTAELLGLHGVDVNTLHVQNTRGKLEASVVYALHQMSITLARFATDLTWFSSEAFGFFRLPAALTTGSSIMPQKRNPDVLELLRAMPSAMLGRYAEITSVLPGLGCGYHRDLQRTKAPMLHGMGEMRSALAIADHLVEELQVDESACQRALRDEIYATDRAYEQVRAGVPFREAYINVKEQGAAPLSAQEVLSPRVHLGAVGTQQAPHLRERLDSWRAWAEPYRRGAAVARQRCEA